MEIFSGIGLQEIGIAGAITVLLLREILKFVQGLMAIKGKQDRRMPGEDMSCPFAKRDPQTGLVEFYQFKRDLNEALKQRTKGDD